MWAGDEAPRRADAGKEETERREQTRSEEAVMEEVERGRCEESMSGPTRAGYIFYTSKGWTLKINPVILSLHDLT